MVICRLRMAYICIIKLISNNLSFIKKITYQTSFKFHKLSLIGVDSVFIDSLFFGEDYKFYNILAFFGFLPLFFFSRNLYYGGRAKY